MAETVSLNFDVDDLIEEAEAAIKKSIAKGTSYAEQNLRNRIPSQRTETAKAVTSRSSGMQGEVDIKFPANRRYRTSGTQTEKIVEQAWRATEVSTLAVIEKEFYDQIEE